MVFENSKLIILHFTSKSHKPDGIFFQCPYYRICWLYIKESQDVRSSGSTTTVVPVKFDSHQETERLPQAEYSGVHLKGTMCVSKGCERERRRRFRWLGYLSGVEVYVNVFP